MRLQPTWDWKLIPHEFKKSNSHWNRQKKTVGKPCCDFHSPNSLSLSHSLTMCVFVNVFLSLYKYLFFHKLFFLFFVNATKILIRNEKKCTCQIFLLIKKNLIKKLKEFSTKFSRSFDLNDDGRQRIQKYGNESNKYVTRYQVMEMLCCHTLLSP